MSETQSKTPLKILCFHGYRQSGEAFYQKTGSLRKALKSEAQLFYLTAPNIVPPSENSGNEDGGRAWWFSQKDKTFSAKQKTDFVLGFKASLKVIEDYNKNHDPFDGLLGFSQGASMVSLLCYLQEHHKISFYFNFAIIVSGFKAQSGGLRDYYDIVWLPTLHVIGETDQVIGKEPSEDLLQYFDEPIILSHPGGHFVPAANAQKETYINFLKYVKNVHSYDPYSKRVPMPKRV